MNQKQGFVQALFDLSFTTFITEKLIKVIYVAAIVLSGLTAVTYFFGSFGTGFGNVLVNLILAPLFFLLAIIICRIWLEVTIVLFRIADHAAEIARASRKGEAVASSTHQGQ